jgi:purine-binding chemotaxis protein CheW
VSTAPVKLVTFLLGTHRFAADVFSVERVLRYVAPNAVPDMPVWIAGVIDYRGAVVPVIDLRRRIGLPGDEHPATARILVLSTSDGWVGAVVDAVLEVATVAASQIAPPPALFRGLASEFMRGITHVREHLVVVLEVDRVLSSTARIAFDASGDADGAGAERQPASVAASNRG